MCFLNVFQWYFSLRHTAVSGLSGCNFLLFYWFRSKFHFLKIGLLLLLFFYTCSLSTSVLVLVVLVYFTGWYAFMLDLSCNLSAFLMLTTFLGVPLIWDRLPISPPGSSFWWVISYDCPYWTWMWKTNLAFLLQPCLFRMFLLYFDHLLALSVFPGGHYLKLLIWHTVLFKA